MPAKIVWNDALDDALRNLIEQGAGRDMCAEEMGISWPVLRRRLRELGIRVYASREVQPETLRAIEMVKQGCTPAKAERAVGLGKGTVARAINRMQERGQ